MSLENHRTLLPHGLPAIKRYITNHDNTGKAIFATPVAEHLDFKSLPFHAWENSDVSPKAALGYATKEFPTKIKDEADVAAYENFLSNPPGLCIPNGTVFRVLDIPPKAISPMHRTKSLDYAIVLEGTVVAGLDSGQEKLLHRGDILIQRNTNHNWKNASETDWARMAFILIDSEEGLLPN